MPYSEGPGREERQSWIRSIPDQSYMTVQAKILPGGYTVLEDELDGWEEAAIEDATEDGWG